MNARIETFPVHALRVRDVALAAIAEICPAPNGQASVEVDALQQIAAGVRRNGRPFRQIVEDVLRRPAVEDAHLLVLAADLHLALPELLAVALAVAVEDEPIVGRVLAHVQAPVGGSRPTLGLLTHAFGSALDPAASVLPSLLDGWAVRSGLLSVLNESAPLPERAVMVPAAVCLAMSGHDGRWPGAAMGLEGHEVPLPVSVLEGAERHATALQLDVHRALVLRTGSQSEGCSVAAAIARAIGRRAVFVDGDRTAGLAPWLILRRLVPVFCWELAPGERRRLPALPGYSGPVLAVCGPDGSVEPSQGTAATWMLRVPSPSDRRLLWTAALGDQASPQLADRLATHHLHGAGRIADLGRLACHQAALAGRVVPDEFDVIAAASSSEGGGLDALAAPLQAQVSDDALVAAPTLRADLESLVLRCLMREDLCEGLGPSARTRYCPGVRALFTGPSGTGKTLAAGWLATRLGLPLLRVDLASVTSKYIGETEKHLSRLLARAEQAEVILLFDEADSLFGKRTDIRDANDRFANAQTNYLLQRIESYNGIVLLTSNSQARFDDAFARRLDFVIEFPAPGPEERRALWRSHLGPNTTLTPAELNQLAVLVDLTGGHTRNAVLAAAVCARSAQRAIEYDDLLAGLEAELRKLGRQMPVELRAGR